jgi:hypothetical protein
VSEPVKAAKLVVAQGLAFAACVAIAEEVRGKLDMMAYVEVEREVAC